MASASLYSLEQGGNVGQKMIGIIAVLLLAHGKLTGGFHVALWVVLSSQSAMASGALFGGWRIGLTMRPRITRLTPQQGAFAKTGGTVTVFLRPSIGAPVSVPRPPTGAILGVGAARRAFSRQIQCRKPDHWPWAVTMPAAALARVMLFTLARLVSGLHG